MDKKTNKIISDFVATTAKQNPGLLKAYLFGSYARQLDKPDSDIDVALVIENLEDKDRFDLQVQLILLAAKFDSRIEPHPVSRSDFNSGNPFIAEIKKTGIEIEPEMPDKWFSP